jgi:hypothetical protein
MKARLALASLCLASGGLFAQPSGLPGGIGVNKVDLFSQYMGTASGGDGSPEFRRVTRAMARKSLDDLRDAGVRLVRVPVAGHVPAARQPGRDLGQWQSNPAAFWAQMDEMMADLDKRDMRMVPVLMWGGKKFADMAGETMGPLLRDPNSRSWQLLAAFSTDFVNRYKGGRTIAFYELTNEANNQVDIDIAGRCRRGQGKANCALNDNVTHQELVAFTARFAGLVRRLDPTRKISSGFSMPRPNAENLRRGPEWQKDSRANLDTPAEFRKNLAELHQHVDIVSVHFYGAEKNRRFGHADVLDTLSEVKRAADAIGKPLFLGEFGVRDSADPAQVDFLLRMMERVRQLQIPYSALWVWDFYQADTQDVRDRRGLQFSLGVGYADRVVGRLREINAAPAAQARDSTPPRVVLTWPLACRTVLAPLKVSAVASDDSGRLQRVEFSANGVRAASADGFPYSVTLDAKALKQGRNRLTVRAVDAAGNAAEFSTDVLVGPAQDERCVVTP